MVSFFGKSRAEFLAYLSCLQAEERRDNVLSVWRISRCVSMQRNARKRPQPRMRRMGLRVKERAMVAHAERFANSRFAHSAGEGLRYA